MSAVCHVPAAWQPDHPASCCWYTLCHFLIYVWLVLAVLRLFGCQSEPRMGQVRFSICLALLPVVISYEYITKSEACLRFTRFQQLSVDFLYQHQCSCGSRGRIRFHSLNYTPRCFCKMCKWSRRKKFPGWHTWSERFEQYKQWQAIKYASTLNTCKALGGFWFSFSPCESLDSTILASFHPSTGNCVCLPNSDCWCKCRNK